MTLSPVPIPLLHHYLHFCAHNGPLTPMAGPTPILTHIFTPLLSVKWTGHAPLPRDFFFFLICVWMRTMFLPENRSTFCQNLLCMVTKNRRRQAVKSGPASRQYSWQIPAPKHTVCELGEPVTSPLQTSITFISKLGWIQPFVITWACDVKVMLKVRLCFWTCGRSRNNS